MAQLRPGDLQPGADELRRPRWSPAIYLFGERTIIDSFRLAYREGNDVANIALRRWLAQRGTAAPLLRLAEAFPKALPRLRHALEVLLCATAQRDTPAGRAYNDLRNLARRDGRDPGEYLTLYALEGFLSRLADSTYADDFVLKGGVLMAAFTVTAHPRIDLAAVRMPNDVAEVERESRTSSRSTASTG